MPLIWIAQRLDTGGRGGYLTFYGKCLLSPTERSGQPFNKHLPGRGSDAGGNGVRSWLGLRGPMHQGHFRAAARPRLAAPGRRSSSRLIQESWSRASSNWR